MGGALELHKLTEVGAPVLHLVLNPTRGSEYRAKSQPKASLGITQKPKDTNEMS